MAEGDDQHDSGAPGGADEEEDALQPDAQLEGWATADGPEGSVRSWSEIAELDDESVAEDSGDVRIGPDGKAIGGLLGVDSGLLRFLENEESEGALPSVAVTSEDPDDGGALPVDLSLSSAPPAAAPPETAAFDDAGPQGSALPMDLDLDLDLDLDEDDGGSLFGDVLEDEAPEEPEVEAVALPPDEALEADVHEAPELEEPAPAEAPLASAEAAGLIVAADEGAERDGAEEEEEEEEDGDEDPGGWISSVVADLDLGADLGAEWAGGVVDDALMDRSSTGWSRVTGEAPDEEAPPAADDDEDWGVIGAEATGADLLLPGGLDFIPADNLDLEEEEPIPDGIYEGEPEPVQIIDTWGEEEPAPPARRVSAPLPAQSSRVEELDPFASPSAASLQDETGTLDPFDSLGASANDFGQDWLGRQGAGRAASAPPPVVTPPPASDPPFAVEPDDSMSDFSLLAPSDDSVAREREAEGALPQSTPPTPEVVEQAVALLAERSEARRAELEVARADGESMRLDEPLQDSDDRRVTMTEYAELVSLELDPAEAAPVADADVIEAIDLELAPPAVQRRNALEALSEEPVEIVSGVIDADVVPVPPPLPATVEMEVSEADVIEVVSTEAPEMPRLDERLDPTWGQTPAPVAFTEDVERLGVPFLGAIPSFDGPERAPEAFPIGALPLVEAPTLEGGPVLPQLSEPRGDRSAPARHLHAMLEAEIATEVDRGRLALLLHELGWLAETAFEDPGLALQAYRASHINDPEFALNRWSLHRVLEASGSADEVVALLARRGRADADALYRAGHLALSGLNDPERALALWRRASDVREDWLAPLIARYATHLHRLDWEGAARVLDDALEATRGPVLWGLLALERARLTEELGEDVARVGELQSGAVDKLGGTPALLAAVERHAFEHGDLEPLLHALRARYDRVMADFQAGLVDEASAQWEVGEVFYKAAWTFERLGRNAEALRRYHDALRTLPEDRFVRYRAGELARRLGKADEHREHLAELAGQATDPSEAANIWYQMGLIAQQVLADESAARENFERAVEALPSFTPALAALGRQALRQGRFDELQRRFNQEIRQLEESLGGVQPETVRERTVRGLVQRYYRVARLLEQQIDVSDQALEYDKRALSVEPSFLPSFIAMERIFERGARWKELTALYLGRVDRGIEHPDEALPLLLAAADIVGGRLGDQRNAARLYARALAVRPDHTYALRRASEAFSAIGNHGAQVEVDLRWGRRGDPRADAQLLRAAQIQELDGDPLAAAAEALTIYRDALDRLPDHPAAIDGVARVTGRLGRTGELAQLVERHDLGSLEAPALVLQLAEALLAGGRTSLAARVLRRWRQRRLEPVSPAIDRALNDLLGIAYERGEAWRPLVDVLEEQAAASDGARSGGLLARVGELWEMRLDEPGLAADAYGRALQAEPDCGAARAGLRRLAFRKRGEATQAPPIQGEDLLLAARSADSEGDRARRNQALLELADAVPDASFGAALREIADPGGRSLDEVAGAFDSAPERRDLFEDCRRRVASDGRDEAVAAVLRRRLAHEDAAGMFETFTSLLGHTLATGDHESARHTARQILELDPTSLPAMLALRRLARQSGDEAATTVAGERLLAVLRAPGPAAETHLRVALEAEATGARSERVRALLEQAVALDPTAEAPAVELAKRLEAAGAWELTAELHGQRLRALRAPGPRRRAACAQARVLADRLDDVAGALEVIRAELEHEPIDFQTAFLGAGYADQLERYEEADQLFAQAAAAEAGRGQAQARTAHARSLLRRGATAVANSVLDALLAESPRDIAAVELKAEAMAASHNWRGVLEAYRRLFALEVEPARRAERATALGEVLSRVLGDHVAAAGWFKRAVELLPRDLRAVWRMLEEVEAAPEGRIPLEHVDDAVDRAIGAVRARHAEDPGDVDALRQLARLYRRRGRPDACFLACAALEYLGAANDVEHAFYRQRRQRLTGDFSRPLSPELRRELLVHPGEAGSGRAVFDAFSLVLAEMLSDRIPQGLPRLSRRSFAEWQGDFRQLASGLGVEDIELWNGGGGVDELRGCYLPQPALIVPTRMLEGRIDAAESFVLGNLVEGLRERRLLFERHGGRLVERCVGVMAEVVSPGLVGPVPDDGLASPLRARLEDRARRLPRRLKLQLDALMREREGKRAPNVASLADAVEHTRNRAGLLCAGDLAVALDHIVFDDAHAAGQARQSKGAVAEALRGSKAARALLAYALSPAHIKLRSILGLAVS